MSDDHDTTICLGDDKRYTLFFPDRRLTGLRLHPRATESGKVPSRKKKNARGSRASWNRNEKSRDVIFKRRRNTGRWFNSKGGSSKTVGSGQVPNHEQAHARTAHTSEMYGEANCNREKVLVAKKRQQGGFTRLPVCSHKREAARNSALTAKRVGDDAASRKRRRAKYREERVG